MKIPTDGFETVKCQKINSTNRNRFYPEIEWADLSHEQKLIKDATVEMFLKTLELIIHFTLLLLQDSY